MATPAKHRTGISPSAIPLMSTTTAASSSSSCSSPYFLPELIPLIASRLTTLQDFFALRAACRTYRALLPPSPANLASQGPLLLVPHHASASEALYHASLRRFLRFHLPCRRSPSHTRFHSFGCRVAIYDRNVGAFRLELSIHHLLTGERSRLPEPPKRLGEKIIFSGDLVLIFARYLGVLHYCRIGDDQWRKAECAHRYRLYSLIFVKGTLYALIGPDYRLAVIGLHGNSVECSFLGDESSAQSVKDRVMFCLAECRDELLLVVAVQYSPRVYHVFRWQSTERKWARTTTLGGCSLFFNTHQFAGCLGPDRPAVRRDCLYFTWCSGHWSEYSLVDGSSHEQVADYPGQAATEYYMASSWVLASIF